MNSHSYIIQKIDQYLNYHNTPLASISKKKLYHIYKKYNWYLIVDTIPEVEKYYHSKYKKHIKPTIDNQTLCFIQCKYNNPILLNYIEKNKDKIRQGFIKIKNAFDIVNIKYDRVNFLSYNFVLSKILIQLGEHDLAELIPKLKSPDNLYNHNKIWNDIESILKTYQSY